MTLFSSRPPQRTLAPCNSPSAAVDVFIGTGGDGHCHPGATRPFGMVQLGPDTAHRSHRESYPWCAGYRYEDDSILGFSHTHFSGTGHGDLGDVLLMPFTGAVRLEPGYPERAMSGYRSRFSHEQERGEPGYYAVRLLDQEVDVELTASERVGLHRYHYGENLAAQVLLDLRSSIYDHKDKNQWARLRMRSSRLITGMRQTRGWAPGRQLHFAIEFSQPVQTSELHNTEEGMAYRGFRSPGRVPQDKRVLEGTKLLGVFGFGQALPAGQLLVKVAISAVSEDKAMANLAEMPGWDFDAERAAAAAAWAEVLGVLEIDADEATRRNLYTAHYHAAQAPSLFMDLDGEYRGPDNQVHCAEGFRFHSTFSLWDTYRALHPWLILTQSHQRNADFINSLLASQTHSPHGILPVWQFHGLETWCMIGYHALPVIADAHLKGISGFDPQRALQAMRASAEYSAYGGIGDYLKYGYVPFDLEGEGASKTLEYAFDDWTLARMAESLGEAETAATYYQRAQSFRQLLDPVTGFVRGKHSSGEFRTPFDPTAAGYGSDYTEGSAWQYSWYVPHDGAALVANLGGDVGMVKRLDEIFEAETNAKMYAHMEDIAGLIGHYAHGNEPSHHIAYLYAFAGAPWKTQARLAQIVPSQYQNGAAGLAGNDDLGQMSAWLLFSALGFYPVAPGSNEYVIGRPFVRAARLRLPNGKTLSIRCENYSEAHVYVGALTLNGQPHAPSVLRHEDVMAGAELVFSMQAEPNQAWGVAAEHRPYTQTPYV